MINLYIHYYINFVRTPKTKPKRQGRARRGVMMGRLEVEDYFLIKYKYYFNITTIYVKDSP